MPCAQDPLLRERGIQVDKFVKDDVIRSICLTHAHMDHLSDLTKNFKNGTIYATMVTARLAMMTVKNLKESVFKIVQMYKPFYPGKNVTAWAFPAYHCDGSCMFLFEVDGNFRILYTGDYRWNPEIRKNTLLMDFRVHRLYYDDMFDEIDMEYPSFQESFQAFRKKFVDLQMCSEKIHIQASILGSEPMLRELSDEFGIRYCLSPSLIGTWRGKQLEYLLEHRLSCENTPYELGILKRDKDLDEYPWIIPTCTYFLCAEKPNQADEKYHYIQFCTHSNRAENNHLKALLSPKEINPCQETIGKLKCDK